MTYKVYMLRCADDTLYTGITNDLERRVATHNAGKGAKYTRARLPVELAWHTEVPTKSQALKEERRIKKLRRHHKLALIEQQDG